MGDSRPRRLAWVVPGPLDQLTGGYLYDARIVRGLRARGHDVEVVQLAGGLSPLHVPAAVRMFLALGARRWSAVVVDELAHGAMLLGLPGFRLTAAGRSTPVVALVHHLRCSEPQPTLARRRAALIERAALALIDAAVCTSASTAREVRRLVRSGLPIDIVTPGWDLHGEHVASRATNRNGTATVRERPQQSDSTAPSRSRCSSGNDPEAGGLRLLTVAHWTPRKGLVETLRALALTPPGVHLDLVGDQDRDPAYTRRVWMELRRPELTGRVRVHGRVSSERLADLYRQADALALASTHEGYGMVLAEALAAGLPIVATRVGAIPEVVRDGLEAELVEAGDVAGLAGALTRLAHDPIERQRRSACARERASSLPNWEESCAAFAAVLDRAILARGGSRAAPERAREHPSGGFRGDGL
ncbi:MAG: glycosyltransferase family 4 protein [Chloroflexi bacterium]|nr:glycosyltransferase family 4 protein [Chloroflexota bacterium]